MRDKRVRAIISALKTQDAIFQKYVQTGWKDNELHQQYKNLGHEIIRMIQEYQLSKNVGAVFGHQDNYLIQSD